MLMTVCNAKTQRQKPSTPAVDGDHIYSAWGTPSELKVVAVRHDGSVAWESDNLGPVFGGHGFGTSPIGLGNLVLIANATEKKSSLLALDRMTGKVASSASSVTLGERLPRPRSYH